MIILSSESQSLPECPGLPLFKWLHMSLFINDLSLKLDLNFSQFRLSVDDTNQGGFFMKFKVVVQTRTTVFETIIEAIDMARARLIAQQQYPGAMIGGCYRM